MLRARRQPISWAGRTASGAPDRSGRPLSISATGARLERLDWPADLSERGRKQSYGLMVNYLYDLGDIRKRTTRPTPKTAPVIAAGPIRKLGPALARSRGRRRG